jgi:3-oxoacyl-[acyl-carrier-protein] synthase II
VVIGTAAGGAIAETQLAVDKLYANQRISPIRFTSVWPNMAAFTVAWTFNYTGYNATISTAYASGTHALVTAAEAIHNGHADLILAGGADAFNTYIGVAGYTAMGVLSERSETPEQADEPLIIKRCAGES